MTTPSVNNEILRQLADIQRSLGEVISDVRSLREDVMTNGSDSTSHRRELRQTLSNILTRVGQTETDITTLKQVVEKTVNPLVEGYSDNKQRVIGFMAAFSMIGAIIAGLIWFLTTGLPEIVKFFSRAAGS